MKLKLIFLLLLIGCSGPKGDVGSKGTPGNNGPPGVPGEDGTMITSLQFCPKLGGGIGFKESYLVLNNFIYAVYYDGTHTFLALLHAGNYVTTDGRDCHFTITTDNQITY